MIIIARRAPAGHCHHEAGANPTAPSPRAESQNKKPHIFNDCVNDCNSAYYQLRTKNSSFKIYKILLFINFKLSDYVLKYQVLE